MIERPTFKPLPGLSSPHIQTVVASLIPPGEPPPSTSLVIPLGDGDSLYCQMSTPLSWSENQETIVMVHGLGGNDSSNYMIRIGRKLYEAGYRVLRLNLRGTGSGSHLAKLPYHGGSSGDVFEVVKTLREQSPLSPIILLGFSLGGNIALKLSGELGEDNLSYVDTTIAVCSPIDLEETVKLLTTPSNRLYHRYYLNEMLKQGERWTNGQKINSLYEFDNLVTAPTWGFKNAIEYYRKSSSLYHIPNIKHRCYLLLASDDPFVDHRRIEEMSLPKETKIALCQNGGHMGFLGWVGKEYQYYWLDHHLLNWIANRNHH